jgi:hypothetical protein
MFASVLVDSREFLQIERDEGVLELSIEEKEHADGNEGVLRMRKLEKDHDVHRHDERSKKKGDEGNLLQLHIEHDFGRKLSLAPFDV